MTKEIGSGYRQRQVGEVVDGSDYLQIGTTYFPVAGSIWVGDTIDNTGPFSRVWTKQ